MFNNLTNQLAAIDTNIITGNPVLGSAFLRAGTNKVTSKGGFTYTSFTGLKGQGLKEGGVKVASGSGSTKKSIPEKLVVSTVWTDETIMFLNSIFEAVTQASPKANGVAFDRIVLGVDAKPAEWTAFDTFTGVTEVEVQTLTEFNSTLSSIPTTAMVGTRAYLGYLRSEVNGLGMPAYNIVGGFGKEQDAEVNGIPYFILDKAVSTGSFAIAGDFTSYYVAKLLANDLVKVKDAGNITDVDGVTHNLTAENKTAVMVENWLASGIGSLADFVKLVPVTP